MMDASTHPDRGIIFATIDDALHFTPEQREQIVASYPAHEREARTRGVPSLGSGRIFPVTDEQIICEPIIIPVHWVQINGVDFGWDHPFAAVNCAWDRDADVFYVCKEYRQRETTPVIHAAAVKPWGEWIPVAWPHDGLQHDKGSGKSLRDIYAGQGLIMLSKQAQFPDGGNGVEAGVLEILDRMQTGRFKVFSTCQAFMGEVRLYHRDEGKIVKLADDLISAARYAYMMRRFATYEPRDEYEEEVRGRSGTTGY